MSVDRPPVAFLSYTRVDDQHEGGQLSDIRKRLQGEVRFQTGDSSFIIFQDRIHIKWGQDWRNRIAESLDEAMFLIPVITPNFFDTVACCEELASFLAREKQLDTRLVLPLFYQDCKILYDPAELAQNEHAQAIEAHQYRSGRKLRFVSLDSRRGRKRISKLATEIASLLPKPERVVSAPIPRTPGPAEKSDQAPTRITEPGPTTQADPTAEIGEADASNEMQTRAPEDTDGPQSMSQVAVLGYDSNNLADADDPQPLLHGAANALGTQVNFRDRLKIGAEGPEMMVIPSGQFGMGDIAGTADQSEQPVHAVILKSHFAIGRYTVTFDEYDFFCEATKRSKPPDEGWGRGHKPVINVSWEDANAFCGWLSEQSGFHYRLPSEAEWKYAARGGTESAYWWGETFDPELTHCNSTHTVPAESLAPNPFGLFQVHGNVWEWVEDVWQESYKGAPEDGSAQSTWLTHRQVRTETREIRYPANWHVIRGITHPHTERSPIT